ncbi:MAG: hypothetical protein JNL34_14695 [Anaerolineae bacterium]|nr:hypothetical protein [Anaerolineae bacterium]
MSAPPVILPPIPRRWQRLLTIGGGLAVFLWLRLEDHGVITALIMGLIAATLIFINWLWPHLSGRPHTPRKLIIFAAACGAGLGLLTALASAFLMLLKNGFHGHLNPDYPAGLLLDTLGRAPAWALAGALLAVAAALAALAARNR